MFSLPSLCLVYLVYVQFTKYMYSLPSLCIVYLVYVQFTQLMYSLPSLCIFYLVYVQFTQFMYSLPSLCIVYLVNVQFTQFIYLFIVYIQGYPQRMRLQQRPKPSQIKRICRWFSIYFLSGTFIRLFKILQGVNTVSKLLQCTYSFKTSR